MFFRMATTLILLMSAGTGAAMADVIDVPGPGIITIQDGINAAAVSDTVQLATGNYTGVGNRDITFDGKSILLRGTPGEQSTIDCEGVGRAFTLSSSGFPTVEHLVVTGSGVTAVDGPDSGRATFRDCVFRENTGYSVIGSMESIVERCTIENNDAMGIVVGGGRVVDCLVRGNMGTGIGIAPSSFGGAEIVNTVITGNFSDGVGGGVRGGAYREAVFRGCTISGNQAAEVGGGVHVAEGTLLRFEDCIIRFNCAGFTIGNDAYVFPSDFRADLTFECCAVDSNEVFSVPIHNSVHYVGEQVISDPLFCGPTSCDLAPTTVGDYSLQTGSPCLANSAPCGEQIGARSVGCLEPASVPVVTASDMRLSVVPNPVQSSCVFTVPSRLGTETLRIYANDGRLVREIQFEEGSCQWDRTDLHGEVVAAGVYHALASEGPAARLIVIN